MSQSVNFYFCNIPLFGKKAFLAVKSGFHIV